MTKPRKKRKPNGPRITTPTAPQKIAAEENDIYREYAGITADTKCGDCFEPARELRKDYGDNVIRDSMHSPKTHAWICGNCRENDNSEPNGTVLIYRPQNRTVEKFVIHNHTDDRSLAENVTPDELEELDRFEYDGDDENSPIDLVWKSTDAWRGYFEPKAEGWSPIHSDCALAYSADEQELKKFDTELKQLLWRNDVTFAIVFGRTSNLFSCGYDLLVEKNGLDPMKYLLVCMMIEKLKHRFRDPERYRLTALTGKDEFDEKDHLLATAQKRLEAGENPDTVITETIAEATKT